MTVFIYLLVLVSLFVRAELRYVKVNANLELTMIEPTSTRFSEDLVRICAQQTELSSQELAQFESENATEATKCFTHCLYEQLGLMHDGVFVEPDALDIGQPSDNCHLLLGSNKCETAHKIHQCKLQMQAGKFKVGPAKMEESTNSPRPEI